MKLVIIAYSHFLLANVVCLLSGCSSIPEVPKPQIPEAKPATTPSSSTTPSLVSSRSIRRVDFSNFSYPLPKDFIEPAREQKPIILRDGKLSATRDKHGFVAEMGMSLINIGYGDATGDGEEEAIIVLSVQTGGSALPNIVYVYTWRDERPFLLWSFVTGDRADDGLRRVFTENGKLLLELYSPIDKKGDCCPAYFKRIRLIWRGNRFRLESKEELLPNPEEHGSPIP